MHLFPPPPMSLYAPLSKSSELAASGRRGTDFCYLCTLLIQAELQSMSAKGQDYTEFLLPGLGNVHFNLTDVWASSRICIFLPPGVWTVDRGNTHCVRAGVIWTEHYRGGKGDPDWGAAVIGSRPIVTCSSALRAIVFWFSQPWLHKFPGWQIEYRISWLEN